MTLWDLNHQFLARITRSSDRYIIARHAYNALDSPLVGEDGNTVDDEVTNADAAATATSVVAEDPVAINSECRQHGRALSRADVVAVREAEVDEAGCLEERDGGAHGVACEVEEGHFGWFRPLVGDRPNERDGL